MIVVTGAAGFIGSNLIRGLNRRGVQDIIAVDNLTQGDKFSNLVNCCIADYVDCIDFRQRIKKKLLPEITAILHQGANSDTTEKNGRQMLDNNYRVTLELFEYSQEKSIQLLCASSAAVYGDSFDCIEEPEYENPLNVYGYSKLLFDRVLRQRIGSLNSQVVSLRYFNVYGQNEQHKGRMASVILHCIEQFLTYGYVELFTGWNGYENGHQSRDFISVEDVVAINLHFLDNKNFHGIYNCGTGQNHTFNDVAATVINAIRSRSCKKILSLADLVVSGKIRYVPFPENLKGRYQNCTKANLSKLRRSKYTKPMCDIQKGITHYVHCCMKGQPSL